MYKITSVGTRNNGWYHISHPVWGHITQVRGYRKAVEKVAEFETVPPPTKAEFSIYDYYQSMINKETTT
jgi:hypothetical protein